MIANNKFYTSHIWLIYISIGLIILDGIFGIDIMLNNTSRLSPIYRAAFLAKVFIVLLSIIYYKKIPLNSFVFIFLSLISIKLLLGMYEFVTLDVGSQKNIQVIRDESFIEKGSPIKSFLAHIYFYSFVIFGYISGWQIHHSGIKKILIKPSIIKLAVTLTFFICALYFALYQLGYITYFGIGLQTYIVVAVLMASQSSIIYHLIIALATLLTGKRSSFIVYITQVFGPQLFNRKFTLFTFFSSSALLSILFLFAFQIGLLDRFKGVIDLFVEFDSTDLLLNRDLLFLASGGRTEEIFAYFYDLTLSWPAFLFGQITGYTFFITDWYGDVYEHYYFHISPLNYMYHFGVPLGILISLYQVRILFWAFKYVGNEKNIFCFLYIGFYMGSIFGAIIVIDIFFWVIFFYCHFLYQENKYFKNPS